MSIKEYLVGSTRVNERETTAHATGERYALLYEDTTGWPDFATAAELQIVISSTLLSSVDTTPVKSTLSPIKQNKVVVMSLIVCRQPPPVSELINAISPF